MRFTFSYFLLPLIVLTACLEKDNASELLKSDSGNSDLSLSHGMIVLGDRLDNPYATENMREAYSAVYPTKSRDVIETTHYYVRFLPESDAELAYLRDMDLVLYDHPLDYEIVVDGDYYHDPSLAEGSITWQYTVVGKDFDFPDIKYEIIEECCMDDPGIETRTHESLDWELLERQAYIITGNEDRLPEVQTKVARHYPEGRFTFYDEYYNGGTKVGVSGVKVVCNSFVKIGKAYTDENGYFKINKSFLLSKVRYSIVFENVKGFDIGFNLIIIPASVSGLGRHSSDWFEMNFNKQSDPKTWRRSVVNNAMYDYYARMTEADSAVKPFPGDFRIWIFESAKDGYAMMMHHGAVWEGSFISQVFPKAVPVLKLFSPDVVVGLNGIETAADLYSLCYHEASHASHYRVVGNKYWNSYAAAILAGLLRGTGRYGDGTVDLDGYNGVTEMWAFYHSAVLYKQRYGVYPEIPEDLWFDPQFLIDVHEHGIDVNSVYSVLSADIVSVPVLGQKLVERYESVKPGLIDIYESYFGPMPGWTDDSEDSDDNDDREGGDNNGDTGSDGDSDDSPYGDGVWWGRY